jgi:LysR family hydrogen peroxide-inducible transcriptional activator
MNIRALQYFIALAELRHFGRAAERCHVSQPTLSTQIKKLEQELGVDLIERNSRQVLLTEAGENVLGHARRAVEEIETIRRLSRLSDDPFGGTLSLGIFPTLAPYLLPHVIPSFRATYPKLTIRLFEDKTEEVTQMLLQGRLDAILVALPVQDERLHVEPLFQEPFVLVLPTQHRLADKSTISVSDLKSEQLLLLEDGHCFRDQALDVCRLAGASEHVEFRASSLETLRYMVAANSGITLMPILATQPPVPRIDSTVVRPFMAPTPARTIALAWRKSSGRTELLQGLAKCFRALDASLLQPTKRKTHALDQQSKV